MMSQANLDSILTYQTRSATSPREYAVTVDPPDCQCDHWRYRKTPCRHILEASLVQARERIAYLSTRFERPNDPFFVSFEHLLAHYRWRTPKKGEEPDAEFDYLANLFMALLYPCEQLTTDVLHDVVQEKFAHDPRIIGAVVGTLSKKKVIEPVGQRKSERPQCHYRRVLVWALTDQGRKMARTVTE